MESKIASKGRKGVLSHFSRKTRQDLSYIWTCSASLEDAFFRYADAVGDIVMDDNELVFVKYTLIAIEEYMKPNTCLRESGKLYLSKLVDGMEVVSRYNVVSGTAPFENLFDIYNEPFIQWYKRLNAEGKPLRVTKPPIKTDQIKLRESARIVLLSKIASSHTLMMMGIIPMRAMEVG